MQGPAVVEDYGFLEDVAVFWGAPVAGVVEGEGEGGGGGGEGEGEGEGGM